MSEQKVQITCKNCGEVFSTFLKQMAEHNAKVVCPKCGTIQEQHDFLNTSEK